MRPDARLLRHHVPDISIHAPREGCDFRSSSTRRSINLFQSTHPARGATRSLSLGFWNLLISIHAPREGCDEILCCLPQGILISIHAPREGCDHQALQLAPVVPGISIHAPREGCDKTRRKHFAEEGKFQSTHPARGATRSGFFGLNTEQFQSTHPARGATTFMSLPLETREFQSTHPARGATANFTKEQRVCLAQFAYLHKGKKAEHTKTNAPMLH